jgi:trehalose 6-phosphate phosphatase
MMDAAAVAVWTELNMGVITGESAVIEAEQFYAPGPTPPVSPIADHCAVFLDFDGTLTNLARRPDQVVVDGGLLYLLDDLYVATAGATAVISGRSIEDLDAKLAPLRLPIAGIHGAQRRRADGSIERCAIPATVVWQTRMALRMRLRRHEGLFLEDKGSAFAVHYRGAQAFSLTRLRADLDAVALASRGIFEVMEGAKVLELRPRACDKGQALEGFMSEAPFAGRFPIFIGDDQTDRAGFEAVARANGMCIAVGARVSAPWWLPDPTAVRAWLRAGLGLGN